jgi:hypothetical protein
MAYAKWAHSAKPGGTAGVTSCPSRISSCGTGVLFSRRKGWSNMKNEIPYKIYLTEEQMPKAWYNLRADMVNKRPP